MTAGLSMTQTPFLRSVLESLRPFRYLESKSSLAQVQALSEPGRCGEA